MTLDTALTASAHNPNIGECHLSSTGQDETLAAFDKFRRTDKNIQKCSNMCIVKTRFEWDPAKAASNLRKHGVSFPTATRVFSDPYALVEQDRIENGEERWQTVGIVDGVVMLLVAHTVRQQDEIEVIRIISARRADRRERRRYEEENG